MNTHEFKGIERYVGVVMKERHTIIDKWPMRLKKTADEEGGMEEFRALLASGGSGTERYMEWKRTGSNVLKL